jgi:flagellar capping protein FliD
MDTQLWIAVISTSGAVVTAITALVLNHRGFASVENRITGLDNRLTGIEGRVDARFTAFENRIDARLNLMQSTISSLQTDVALLKDKAGIG